MVCVLASGGKPLMPTNHKRMRQLLKKGRARIVGHRPLTIQLLDREDGETQPIEYCCDTGDHHIGISIKSEKREFVSAQYDLLTDEPEKHRDQKICRRQRRNRKRHRKARFDNRRRPEGWLAPTLRHKSDQHALLYLRHAKRLPITKVVVEMGAFDTRMLAAMEAGKPLPEGEDYQRGPRYGYATLREAVFVRDHHKCQVCGKGVEQGAILRTHHLGFRMHDRSNRMHNLLTVCAECHTSANHKPGGVLWDLKPKLCTLASAAHMNTFRWDLWAMLETFAGMRGATIHMTFGAATKVARRALNIGKSHANDAYAMGSFHPKKRTRTEHWRKCRRNNRVLEKFYDAKYVDLRDGKAKSGQQLSCGRTSRSQSRHGERNERKQRAMRVAKQTKRGVAVSRGHRNIRQDRYPFRPGDIVWAIGGKHAGRHVVKGVNSGGRSIQFAEGGSCAPRMVRRHVFTGGWRKIDH